MTTQDFRRRLDVLEDIVSGTEGRILVGSDFNARALEWGLQPDSRGKRILKIAGRTGFVVLNTGSTPPFRRPGCEGRILDITFTSESLASSVDGWREDFSASNHQYIAFEVVNATCQRAPTQHFCYLWNVERVKIGKFVEAFGAGKASLEGASEGDSIAADAGVNSVMNLRFHAPEGPLP